MRICFSVPGAPQGKARPRVVVQGGRSHAFTPKRTVEYEAQIRTAYTAAARGSSFSSRPLSVGITAYYPIPKRASKADRRGMLEGEILPTIKPDCDNIVKVVCDALNGVAYGDDKQIVFAKISKRYAVVPRLEIVIEEVEVIGRNDGQAD